MNKNRIFFWVLSVLMLLPALPGLALVAPGYYGDLGYRCGTGCFNSDGLWLLPLYDYLWRQGLLVVAFYLSGYILGRLVEKKAISASLSRKLVCILTFAISYANSLSIPAYAPFFTLVLIICSGIILLLMLGSLAVPFRNRIPPLKNVFAAINRPEDEPYTLAWLSTEAVATTCIILVSIPALYYFSSFSNGITLNPDLLYKMMLIPIFASGIGDALAEIVGKRWGKHHYTTHAIFGKRTYTRSLEGSAMVFLTTIVVGLAVAWQFSFHLPVSFWKAFILLPITLTLAEAKSPHTWDNPFLYLVGYLTIMLCLL